MYSSVTIKSEIERYASLILADQYLMRKHRRLIRIALSTGILGIIAALSIFVVYDAFLAGEYRIAEILAEHTRYLGVLFLLIVPYVWMLFFSFYYNSIYFRGLDSLVGEHPTKDRGLTYEVARSLFIDLEDVTYSFFSSSYGSQIMLRCGVDMTALRDYLNSARQNVEASELDIPEEGFLTLAHVSEFILRKDPSFQEFLLRNGVSKDSFKGAAVWITRLYEEIKYEERWWSRDALGKVNGLGSEIAYGVAYELERYLRDIRSTTVFSAFASDTVYADEKIEQIENILSRSNGANALVVGDPGVGKMDILVLLGRKILKGQSVASILGKRVIVFDYESFIATHGTKEKFEPAFLRMLSQAEHSGNIIIVIEDITRFLSSAESIGVDVIGAMDRFLASPNLHVVATIDPPDFRNNQRSRHQLVKRFEPVYIDGSNLASTVRVLEDLALRQEVKYKIVFTYLAIETIAESADNYIAEGVMPDKAVDLLVEVGALAQQKKVQFVTSDFVAEYVSQKTGIPSGPLSEEERDRLTRLEDILHTRIIGQNAAVEAISNAMRRTRTGIHAKNKPIGTFLFLGSTGVGKTETAKALAHVFFGNEDKMARLDMTEFADEKGLERLIGTTKEPGALSNILRRSPYGVLLLEEFEKTSHEIHDFFLQILDEGIFYDASGERINARNTIIIATSNAGSDMIWDYAKNEINPSEHKEEIIQKIVEEKIYKPELLNRFDSVVIFEPLTIENQERVAALMLQSLKTRIEKKGYDLVVDEVLINLLVTKGYDPKFGARPMRRVLQDMIEKKIAEKIISNNLKRGDKIWFYEEDFLDDDQKGLIEEQET